MEAMTVKELMGHCEALIRQGQGDKKVYITRDDEGNGVHPLYFQFTTGDGVEQFGLNPDKTVLLG